MKFKQFLNIYHSFYKPESRARGVLILLMRLPGFLFYKPHPSPPKSWEGVWFVKNLIVLAFFIIHFLIKLLFARFPKLSPDWGNKKGASSFSPPWEGQALLSYYRSPGSLIRGFAFRMFLLRFDLYS